MEEAASCSSPFLADCKLVSSSSTPSASTTSGSGPNGGGTLRIALSVDNVVAREEVEALSDGWTSPVVVVVSIRLGVERFNQQV